MEKQFNAIQAKGFFEGTKAMLAEIDRKEELAGRRFENGTWDEDRYQDQLWSLEVERQTIYKCQALAGEWEGK